MKSELLRRPWMDAQPEAFQAAVLSIGQVRSFPAQHAMRLAGEEAFSFFGVLEGCAEVAWTTPTQSSLFHLPWPGDWFGEADVIFGTPRKATIRSRSDCRIINVEATQMRRLLEERPQWWHSLADLASRNFRMTADALLDMMQPDPASRCIGTLLRIAPSHGSDEDQPTIPVSQEELAGLTSLSRNTVGSVIRRLEREGLVTIGYRQLKLLSLPNLRSLAEEMRTWG